jgi:hypothetical protein
MGAQPYAELFIKTIDKRSKQFNLFTILGFFVLCEIIYRRLNTFRDHEVFIFLKQLHNRTDILGQTKTINIFEVIPVPRFSRHKSRARRSREIKLCRIQGKQDSRPLIRRLCTLEKTLESLDHGTLVCTLFSSLNDNLLELFKDRLGIELDNWRSTLTTLSNNDKVIIFAFFNLLRRMSKLDLFLLDDNDFLLRETIFLLNRILKNN